ncbi:FAD-dependent oxidoreductase [bacterium]|nr:FAD-dependent oxidoreductase [bacterium]
MSAEKFDLVVIGSGPAGEKGAAAASYFGKKVALVEKENVLGGAAANTGTLPSKTLRESALYLSGFKQRKLFGFQVDLHKTIHVSDFMAHERFVADQERHRIRENLARHGITLFRGMASFVDAETVMVKPDRCPEIILKAERFLIATGSYPFRPRNFPFHDPRVVKNIECGDLVDVELESGTILHSHAVLVSSGRSGQTGSIGLDKIGVTTNSRGHILVNDAFQTSNPNIYAAGDVIGNPALASTAMAQGRVAVYHAFNLKQSPHFPSLLPSGLYTIPECSSVGRTEDQLHEAGIPFFVGKASYSKNARGQIIGDTEGFLKLLFHQENKKLLGVHVIGEGATEIVHIGLTVMVMGGGVDVFIDTCYNYPTISEVYKYAAYDALAKFDKLDLSQQDKS